MNFVRYHVDLFFPFCVNRNLLQKEKIVNGHLHSILKTMEVFVKNIFKYKPLTKERCFSNLMSYHTTYL